MRPAEIYDLHYGQDDLTSPVNLPDGAFQFLENLMVQGKSLIKRKGYTRRNATAYNSGAAVQRCTQHESNAQVITQVYCVGGKLLLEDATDITNGLTISTSQNVKPVFVNYDGNLIGTDGVNRPFYLPGVTASSAKAITSSQHPSKAGCVATFGERVIFGNVTDTDGAVYPYRMVYGDPGKIDTGQTNSNDFNRNQVIKGFRTHGGSLLVFQNRSIHVANLSSVGGNVNTPYDYRELAPVGTVSESGIVSTEKGIFFPSTKGIFWIPPGPPQSPIYVGKPIQAFWSGLTSASLGYISGADLPDRNAVVWTVPSGDSTTNNCAIFMNYEEWHPNPDGDGSSYPAFSIFTGLSAFPFAFNTMDTLTISGVPKLIGGTYTGFVCNMDTGKQDVTTSIGWEFKHGLYGGGEKSREKIWYRFAIDSTVEGPSTVYASFRLYDRPSVVDRTASTSDVAGTELDSFQLDVDYLGGSGEAVFRGVVRAKSRFIELTCRSNPDKYDFTMNGLLYYLVSGRLIA